jgi:hypothetical protein
VSIYLPFADLRVARNDIGDRLWRPAWPVGGANARPLGTSEFLRNFGCLIDTDPRESDSWYGRRQHVRASFPRMRLDLHPDTDFRVSRFVRRRVYGDKEFPRIFYELVVDIPDAYSRNQQRLVVNVLRIPVIFDNGRQSTIGRMGRLFASELLRATSSSTSAAKANRKLIPGKTLILLSGSGGSETQAIVENLPGEIRADGVHAYDFSGFGAPVANALSRIHIDSEVLAIVAMDVLRGSDQEGVWNWGSLIEYYHLVKRFRNRPTAYGVPNLESLIVQHEHIQETDWSIVRRVFEPRQKRYDIGRGVHMGDNIGISVTGP